MRSTITDLGEIMEQIGLTIWNMEEDMQKTKKTMALVARVQIIERIGQTFRKPSWASTWKIMAMLTQGPILHPETILLFQVDRRL